VGWDSIGTYHYWDVTNDVFPSSWTLYEREFGRRLDTTIPSNAVTMAIGILTMRDGAAGTATTIEWQDYFVTEITNQDPTAPGIKIIPYDDLDTTQLAAGSSRYAMLTDRTDNTTGSQNNFQDTDAILLNKKALDGLTYGLYYKNLEVGDTITFWVSAARWYKFQVDETYQSVGSGSAEAYKLGVVLLDWYDPAPTVNISTSSGTDVEFRIDKFLELPDNLLLDPDFDLSSALSVVTDLSIAAFWDNNAYWVGTKNFTAPSTSPASYGWTFNTGSGPNNSNTITLQPAIPNTSGYVEAWLYARRRLRTNAPAFKVRLRIAVTDGSSNDSLIQVRLQGFSSPTSATVQASVAVGLALPYLDGSTFVDYELLLEGASDPDAQYWQFSLGFNHVNVQDVGEIEIDSIFLYPMQEVSSSLTIVQNAAYTLSPLHRGKTIEHNDSTARVYTVPNDSDIPAGALYGLRQIGSGTLTIRGATGVTVTWMDQSTAGGNSRTAGDFDLADPCDAVLQKDTDTQWYLRGDNITAP